MIKQQAKLTTRLTIFFDLVVVTYAFFISYSFRNSFPGEFVPLQPLTDYLPLFFFALPFWSFCAYLTGLYTDQRIKSRSREMLQVFEAGLLFLAAIAVLAFLFKMIFVSRFFIILFVASSTVFTAVGRIILRSVLRYYRRRGRNARNIAILGGDDTALAIEGIIHLHAEWGLKFAGYILDREPSGADGFSPNLGDIKDFEKILRENVIDEVIFAAPRGKLEELEDELLICEELGVSTKIMLNIFPHRISKAEVEELGGVSMLSFTNTPRSLLSLGLKRVFDFSVSLFAILVLSPVLIGITLAIKLTSRGPVFFRQVRCGKNGREFNLLKFRSMVQDAESLRDKLEHLNEMDGPVFKIKNDPRVTAVGRLIRKTSMDELPQFINVLVGDMSIVGPRPPLPSEVKKYERWQRRRLSVKPGITCYWQISGRNDVDFETWMKMDLSYIDNWSLMEDFKIILKTVPVVLLGKGAS